MRVRTNHGLNRWKCILEVSRIDTTELRGPFTKPNRNIVNELDDSTEPNLFNC